MFCKGYEESWILDEILKLGLVKILNFKFIGDADVWEVDTKSRFWRWIWSRFVFELVIWPQEVTLIRWTQPSGPLCFWQCFLQGVVPWSVKSGIHQYCQLHLWVSSAYSILQQCSFILKSINSIITFILCSFILKRINLIITFLLLIGLQRSRD